MLKQSIAMMRFGLTAYSLFIFALSAIFLHPVLSYSATIEGVVLYDKGLLDTSQVSAYKKYSDIINAAPAYTSSPGDKPGYYKLQLPAGIYYITASGKLNNREFFSYHGANPFRIEEGKLWLPFMTTPKTPASAKDSASAGIYGMVKFNGKPVDDAQVTLYSPDNTFFKGRGLLSSATGPDGTFRFAPEPGEYVIVARKRTAFKGTGPLSKGDLFCYFAGNPVRAAVMKETVIELECYPKGDLKGFLKEEAVSINRPATDITKFKDIEEKRKEIQVDKKRE